MKGFTAMMRILIALTSLILTLMLVMSILPIATGQFNVTQDEEFTATADGYEVKVAGSFMIDSKLNEDVKDVNVYIYAESDNGMKVTILDETRTIKAGAQEKFPFNITISLPELAMLMITENSNKADPGMTVPLKIGVSGTYFHDMLGFDFDMDYDLEVSSTASVSIAPPTKNTDGEVTGITASVSGIATEDQINSFIPDGETIDAKLGIDGAADIGLTVKNEGGNLSVEIGTGSDTSIKDAVKGILDKVSAGEEVSVNVGGEEITLTQEQVSSICDVLDKYVDLNALEAVA